MRKSKSDQTVEGKYIILFNISNRKALSFFFWVLQIHPDVFLKDYNSLKDL